MPILAAEPEMYPPDLWDRESLGDGPDQRWWCLHTKPRQEKATARHLQKQRITHYLPQVIQESRTPGGRKIRASIPLFSGYLFFHGDDHQRIAALKGNSLVNVLTVEDQADLTRDLRQIHQMLSSGLPIVPEPTHPVGAKVRIVNGPLTGMEGTVVRRGQRDQFVAVVRFLGRGAMVDLQDWQVERVED